MGAKNMTRASDSDNCSQHTQHLLQSMHTVMPEWLNLLARALIKPVVSRNSRIVDVLT
jgi:hypothetical protein